MVKTDNNFSTKLSLNKSTKLQAPSPSKTTLRQKKLKVGDVRTALRRKIKDTSIQAVDHKRGVSGRPRRTTARVMRGGATMAPVTLSKKTKSQ